MISEISIVCFLFFFNVTHLGHVSRFCGAASVACCVELCVGTILTLLQCLQCASGDERGGETSPRTAIAPSRPVTSPHCCCHTWTPPPTSPFRPQLMLLPLTHSPTHTPTLPPEIVYKGSVRAPGSNVAPLVLRTFPALLSRFV